MGRRRWQVRLTVEAERDLVSILDWTTRTFGAPQASRYKGTIVRAIAALVEGPVVPGSKARDDVRPTIRILHVARYGQAGRHVLVYRQAGDTLITVLRVLHDAMDLKRHLPTDDEGE
ncbi:type II toxin-antitoxin system RelE/ParE family toxin [Inquilinus limosus]|uniref:type II toxin-antitoxin system RelE/ParE family toxin n=1 Tax=Inquilinus limosus TaxID=171674 RepID=UPI003F14B43D